MMQSIHQDMEYHLTEQEEASACVGRWAILVTDTSA